MFFRALLAISVGFLSAGQSSATAEEMPIWETVNGWQVRVDTTLGGSCFVLESYDDGTLLRLGFNKIEDNGYIMLGNELWRSLEVGKAYDLELQLDNEGVWAAPASVKELGGAKFLYITFSDVDLLTEIAERHTFKARFRGENIARLSLNGSYAAIQEMIRCQQLVNEAAENTDPFSGGQRDDPFDEQNRRHSRDPFAM